MPAESCPCCDAVHQLLAALAERTAGHERLAGDYRAAGDIERAVLHETLADVLRHVRLRLAWALRVDEATMPPGPDPAGVTGVRDDDVDVALHALGKAQL